MINGLFYIRLFIHFQLCSFVRLRMLTDADDVSHFSDSPFTFLIIHRRSCFVTIIRYFIIWEPKDRLPVPYDRCQKSRLVWCKTRTFRHSHCISFSLLFIFLLTSVLARRSFVPNKQRCHLLLPTSSTRQRLPATSDHKVDKILQFFRAPPVLPIFGTLYLFFSLKI